MKLNLNKIVKQFKKGLINKEEFERRLRAKLSTMTTEQINEVGLKFDLVVRTLHGTPHTSTLCSIVGDHEGCKNSGLADRIHCQCWCHTPDQSDSNDNTKNL
jgi:hypothetical protein